MRKVIFIMLMFFILSVSGFAYAQDFTDTQNYWPGWDNGTSDDSKDTIGEPDFIYGDVTVNNDYLLNLSFTRTGGSSHYDVLSPGDLFIDVDSNDVWDYVLDLTSWDVSGKNNSDASAGNYTLYSVALGLNDANGYIFSGSDNTEGWKGYYIRDQHPVAAVDSLLTTPLDGFVWFSGWGDGLTTEYEFDFTSLDSQGLYIQDHSFTFGWTANCGNDAVYEHVAPEPTSLLLLGGGLLGLLGFKKRKI